VPKSFYIIDGHAQIYRAYFAPFRDLTGPTGEPTKATFVFTQWLINLVQARRPDYLAMTIDSGGDEGVFRKEIYPEYKANRKPPPDDFAPQEGRILQIVRDAGIPIFAKPGFEADDLIATMAKRLCQEDWEVFVVSKDKDLRQIIRPCVVMYDMQSGQVTDAARMAQEQGYGPDKAIDVQTLMGDAIDNVPGIPGVGPKTAAMLVNKYGSAEAVLDHLSELTPKLRENFDKHRDRLPLARKLVTLKDDVEFAFEPEQCRFPGLDADALRTHLQSLGFTSLLKRIEVATAAAAAAGNKDSAPDANPAIFRSGLFDHLATAPPPPVTASKTTKAAASAATTAAATADAPPAPQTATGCTYLLVRTPGEFAAFLEELKQQPRFAFDTETDALGAMASNLVGLSFSWKHGCGYYLPVRGPLGETVLDAAAVLAALKPVLEDPAVRKVGHNIKYDLLVMRKAGIIVRGVVLDSMVGAFLIDASRLQYGIDRLALEMLNYQKITTQEMIGKGKNQTSMDRVPLEQIAAYASEDADIALRLADLIDEKLKRYPDLRVLNDTVETPLIDVLVEMESNGIAIDPAILKEQSVVLGALAEALRGQIMEAAGCQFNPDSPKQLADVLFNQLKLKVVKKNKTGPSTDVEVLEKLAALHKCPRLILEYRSLVKLKNTYLDNLTDYLNPRTGRIHASFNQIGAATGRLSCSDPNLQNIPIRTEEGRRIRLAFVPGDRARNVLLTCDYSQVELRLLAHFTQEPALLRAFEADEDIHKAVAAEVFNVPLDQVTKGQRGQAKTINFGIIYGVSAYGLARRIDGLSVGAAQELIDAYNKRFPSIRTFLEQCVMQAQSQGYVETILGRRRPITEIHSSILSMRNAGERMAINSVVQGSAADLIKIAMVNVHKRLRAEASPSRLLLQVHDELVLETPEAVVEAEAELVRQEMIRAGEPLKLKVPLKVDAGWGKNWEEGK